MLHQATLNYGTLVITGHKKGYVTVTGILTYSTFLFQFYLYS